MRPRPYEYYNQSQIFQLLKNNENDIKILMDVAYESAFRRWMSKKMRKEILSLLYDTTFKAIERKEKEIKYLKEKLNEREQRIHELEVTRKYHQNDFANLKDEILHEIKTLTEKFDGKEQNTHEPKIPEKDLQKDLVNLKDEILSEFKILAEKFDLNDQSTHEPEITEKDLQKDLVNLKDEILSEFITLAEKFDLNDHNTHEPEITEKDLQKDLVNLKDEILNEFKTLTEKFDAKEQGAYDLEIVEKYLQKGIANFKDEILNEFKTLIEKLDAKGDQAGDILVEVLTPNDDFKRLGKQPEDKKESENLNEENGIKDKVGGISPTQEKDAKEKENTDIIDDATSTSETIAEQDGTEIPLKTKDLRSPEGGKVIPNKDKITKPQIGGLFGTVK